MNTRGAAAAGGVAAVALAVAFTFTFTAGEGRAQTAARDGGSGRRVTAAQAVAPSRAPALTAAQLAAVATAAGPRVELAAPTARSFCGSPDERWVRAQLGARLGSCEAPRARMTLRAIDRTHDRLDAEWSVGLDGGAELRRGVWVLAPGEVLEPRDPRRAALLTDPSRGPQDAWRAALLALIDEGGCEPGFDDPPAGLGAAATAVPTGVYGDARRGYRALVWERCPVPGGREDAVAYRLRRVDLTPGRAARVTDLAFYCRGRSDCVPPPAR